MPPTLLVIGPSASGKSTIVGALAARGVLTVVPTWTTRPRRPDEADGSANHRFVSDTEFDRLDADGVFLGTVSLFGLPHRYALPRFDEPTDGRVLTIVVRAHLLAALLPHVGEHLTYHVERPLRLAASTLACRASSGCELHARLRNLAAERELGRAVADRVFRNEGPIDDVVASIEAALYVDLESLQTVVA
jgi:ribose 1,5-bisphosphokinase PhnN